jgi:hypothetical protein
MVGLGLVRAHVAVVFAAPEPPVRELLAFLLTILPVSLRRAECLFGAFLPSSGERLRELRFH